jgi:CHAD domain-containing protein
MPKASLAGTPAPQARPAIPARAARASRVRPTVPRVLGPQTSAGEAFRVIALSCLDRFHSAEEGFVATGDADALHRARVALRQLRSALSVFRPILDDACFGPLRDQLKSLWSAMNEARDLDVLIARIDQPPAALAGARERARTRVTEALASAPTRRMLRELVAQLNAPDQPGPADEPVAEFAAASLDRLRRKVRKKGRDFRHLDDDGLHAVRIATKKLRYAAEFFAGLFASAEALTREERSLHALRALQDRLGDLQDIAVAPALLVRLQVPEAQWPELPGRKRLIKRADAAYDRVLAVKPFWR